jgi:RNA polymerase sigma factor (sigma-70 family)
MPDHNCQSDFERDVLPHLDSAYNLARWLTRNDHDAEDVVQEACLRALKYFGSFHGVNCRTWLLTIVRNTCYTWMRRNRASACLSSFDEEIHSAYSEASNPETLQAIAADWRMLDKALEELPAEYREVVILHELEELTYKEIAEVAGIPMGTVMSRLARARKRLQKALSHRTGERVQALHRRDTAPDNSVPRSV